MNGVTGDLLAWSNTTGELLRIDSTKTFARLGEGLVRMRPLAARFVNDSVVEVIDATGPQIITLAGDGAVRRRMALNVPFTAESAAYDGERWIIHTIL